MPTIEGFAKVMGYRSTSSAHITVRAHITVTFESELQGPHPARVATRSGLVNYLDTTQLG